MTADWTHLTLALFGLIFAGLIKGATGIGYASCALPFLAVAVGLKQAIVLVVLPAMVSNVLMLYTTPHFRETLRKFWILYLATLPGTALGLFFLVWANQRTSTLCLGLLIMAYAAFGILRPNWSLPSRIADRLQIPVGLLNGFFTGLTGSQILPLAPYILALHMDANRTVQAMNVAITITSAFLLIGLYQSGVMSMPSLGLSVVAVVPAIAGIQIGARARSLIPISQFRLIIQIVLGLLGLILVVRQVI